MSKPAKAKMPKTAPAIPPLPWRLMVLARANDLAPPEPATAGPSRRFVGRPGGETMPRPTSSCRRGAGWPLHSCPVVVLTNVVIRN